MRTKLFRLILAILVVVIGIAYLAKDPKTEPKSAKLPVIAMAPGLASMPKVAPAKQLPKPKPMPTIKRTLSRKAEGADVVLLQKQLVALGYLAPGTKLDGKFGASTWEAVMAFQKLYSLERTGAMTPQRFSDLMKVKRPGVPTRCAGKARCIDVDITRQVLFEVASGRVNRVIPISSGSGRHYCEKGSCGVAHTPRGNFKIERKIHGRRKSTLGLLFDPNYFTGGYAIHGAPSVPAHPASHGCVRIPMWESASFQARNPTGTPVYVHD